MSKITVLSDGAWGTALAQTLCGNGHTVTMWGPFPDYLAQIADERENRRFLPGVKLSDKLNFQPDMAAAVKDSEMLLLASPTQYMRGVLEKLREHHDPGRHFLVNVAKGIENGTLLRLSGVCRDVLGELRYVVLSGPSHAEEVVKGAPTAVVAASEVPGLAEQARNIFMNDYFRVYTSDDVLSVELGGALKNVMAIAAGIIDGMQLGDNPKAAMITRGIAEMSRLGAALGGQPQTFSGLSGLGDLIVTCCSGHSRNRHVGEELGRGKTLNAILDAMGMVVAEGVKTALSARELAQNAGVECPIVSQVHAILYEDKDPGLAVRELMTRSAKPEMA